MTRTNAPCIDVWLPSVEAAAKVQLMERPGDLSDYADDGVQLDQDDHLDIIHDHLIEPDLDRDELTELSMTDLSAMFSQIVQDASARKAVNPRQDGEPPGGP